MCDRGERHQGKATRNGRGGSFPPMGQGSQDGSSLAHSFVLGKRLNAMSEPSSSKMGRRALLSGGGVVAAGVIIAEAPLVYNFGRRELAIELANLEGVGLDTA